MAVRFTPRRALFHVETARSMALDAATILGNQFDRNVIATMPNELFYQTNTNGSGLVSYFEDPQRSRASGVLLMKFNPEATALKQCCVMSNCAEHHFQELLPTVINQILRYQQSGDPIFPNVYNISTVECLHITSFFPGGAAAAAAAAAAQRVTIGGNGGAAAMLSMAPTQIETPIKPLEVTLCSLKYRQNPTTINTLGLQSTPILPFKSAFTWMVTDLIR